MNLLFRSDEITFALLPQALAFIPIARARPGQGIKQDIRNSGLFVSLPRLAPFWYPSVMSRIQTGGIATTTTGLFMPVDFPLSEYESIHRRIAGKGGLDKAIYAEFAGAWNAVTHRFKALVTHDDLFTASISKHGTAPPAEERHNQERDLFGFFNSGFSMFEAFFYALHAAGALLDPVAFPMTTAKEQRNVTAPKTVARYRSAFQSDPIIASLDALEVHGAYLELREVRNVLAHRTAPGRVFHVSIGDTPAPDLWKVANIVLDKGTTATRRGRLCPLLTTGISAFDKFSASRF
ncbi:MULTISPECIES: hypothetical protein [unclassified Mesorhizobium]|uniref:hypothetical protein n=1 Tax=unclassified Mesorhizobium TaxID=325217 RepID=UPI0003CE645D|nr:MULTISPECIES: hypothetical protein [unclassified Mesorhizobium]ESY52069.1 hypothetical protein X745_20930 [Mesorhizobium sp. LNJC374B00]ESY55990.1 hypothetical protein X744_22445 [Mesorhizobium sp. LNJC372A00]WJI81266.1 hypothetical protein NLY34_00430 [Mesorhizobium sp. C374B]WJI87785.1 hypothetical protein NLY42_02845 [Mesorhizobium sp. C372A]